MKEIRNRIFKFRANDSEAEWIKSKFEMSCCDTMSDFFRTMIMYGIVVKIDSEKYNQMLKDVGGAANNINQIARRINSTGSVYAEDVKQLEERQEEIWQSLKYIQFMLQKLEP